MLPHDSPICDYILSKDLKGVKDLVYHGQTAVSDTDHEGDSLLNVSDLSK